MKSLLEILQGMPLFNPALLPPPEAKQAFDMTVADLKRYVDAGAETFQQRHVNGIKVQLGMKDGEVRLFLSPWMADLLPGHMAIWADAMGQPGIKWQAKISEARGKGFAYAYAIWQPKTGGTE